MWTLLRDFNPIPSSNVALAEAGGAVGWISVLEFGANGGAELVGTSMTAGTQGALCDRPDDTDLVPEVHGKSVDVLCPTAGIRLHKRRCPGPGGVGRIAEPIAGSSCRETLLASDSLRDSGRIDMARLIARTGPPCSKPEFSSHSNASCIVEMTTSPRKSLAAAPPERPLLARYWSKWTIARAALRPRPCTTTLSFRPEGVDAVNWAYQQHRNGDAIRIGAIHWS